MQYYTSDGSNRQGPFELEQLASAGLQPHTLVWREGMSEWQRADAMPELARFLRAPAGPPHVPYRSQQNFTPPGGVPKDVGNTKLAAGLCGIFIGGLGIHKFVLGMTGPGLVMLLVTVLTCGFGGMVMGVIGLIEGIIYLTRPDEEFYRLYIVQKKQWF